MNFDRFNNKVQNYRSQIVHALEEYETKYNLILIYTGDCGLATHSSRLVEDLLNELNDAGEGTEDALVSFDKLNQGKIHSSLAVSASSDPIDIEMGLKQWGKLSDPYKAYFGMVSAEELVVWWKDFGKRLFDANIRQVLGSTEVNEEIQKSLHDSPTKFWYLNNGITIVADKIKKSMIHGSNRDSGTFKLTNAQIVNGAQTVSTIGKFAERDSSDVRNVYLHARIISLEETEIGFGQKITKCNNRQNRIENRDFVSQDPEQIRLKSELSIDGIEYNIVRSESFQQTSVSFDLSEATNALACASGKINLAVQAKREIGKFYENLDGGIYKQLFNPSVSGVYLWSCVKLSRCIERVVQSEIASLDRKSGRQFGFFVHGNRFIISLAMKELIGERFGLTIDYVPNNSLVEEKTKVIISSLFELLEELYPDNILGTLFKNQSKCKLLFERLI